MSNLKKMVLQSFKNLHRARKRVFEGDDRALTAARLRINEEFVKNSNVDNEESIKALIKYAQDVEVELRTQVIQAHKVRDHVYEAKILPETLKIDNTPYNDAAIPEGGIKRGKKSKGCCQDPTPN